jgi:hypothetical protein
MSSDEVVRFLERMEKRLATLADQIQEVRAQSQHSLDRLNLLRRDLEAFRLNLRPPGDTVHDCPVPAEVRQR